jgi:hypothetical protein
MTSVLPLGNCAPTAPRSSRSSNHTPNAERARTTSRVGSSSGVAARTSFMDAERMNCMAARVVSVGGMAQIILEDDGRE